MYYLDEAVVYQFALTYDNITITNLHHSLSLNTFNVKEDR